MIVLCPHCGGDVAVTLLKQSDSDSKHNELAQPKQDELKSKQIDLETESFCASIRSGSASGSAEIGSGSHTGKSAELSKFAYSIDFLTFWAVYPRRKNKGDAWKAWRSSRPNVNEILQALSWQTLSVDWTKDGGQYVPYPASYLRARGWEDEPTPNVAPGATGSATGPSPKRSDYCIDHLDGNSNRWSSRPTASCPTCKHNRAKYPTHPRSVSMEDLFRRGA